LTFNENSKDIPKSTVYGSQTEESPLTTRANERYKLREDINVPEKFNYDHDHIMIIWDGLHLLMSLTAMKKQ
jgi:hypothetical protein